MTRTILAAEELHTLPIPAVAFALISIGTFLFLLLVTWAFRSVGNRHR